MIMSLLFGIKGDEIPERIEQILSGMHVVNIHYDYWSWWIVSEGRLMTTDDNGTVLGDDDPAVVLASTEAIVRAAQNEGGVLEWISNYVPGTVSVMMAPMQASLNGDRLK